MTPGKFDQHPSHARTKSPSTVSVRPSPVRCASRPQNTPYNAYPGQFVMSWHPPLPQSQPHLYHGYHPLEQYPPPQYIPPPPHQSHSCIPVQTGGPSYQQPGAFPPYAAQLSAGGPGPPYAGLHGGVQQYSYPYVSPVQPRMYQYYDPCSPAEPFIRGDPPPVQQQSYPTNYSPPRAQRLRRDPNALVAQGPLSSHPRVPDSGSTTATASHSTIDVLSVTGNPPEQHSVRGLQNDDAHQPNQKQAAVTTAAHAHSSVRRHYHPNPPPNRSEWVMWMGNIPSGATEDELERFLTAPPPVSLHSEANNGVQDTAVVSIFFISRSKCAFVNYRSQEHLNLAVSRFNGRKLRPHDRRCPPLVCKARRKEDDLRAGVGAQRGMGIHMRYVIGKSATTNEETGRPSSPSKTSDLPQPTSGDDEIPESDAVEGANHKVPTRSPSSYASTTSSFLARHFSKRFFILKSLTRYDLDLSTNRGVWATQKHNEVILDQAFRTSMDVILIFSVNKSGEFYGYARMASGISYSDRSVSWAPRMDSLPSTSSTSPSRVPTRFSQQQPSPLRLSQTNTPSSELQSTEVVPIPFVPSSKGTDDCPGATSSPSAPSVPDPPPGPGREGWSQGFEPSSTLRPQSERLPGTQVVVKSRCGPGTDKGNLGSRLLPVVEETHGGVEENQLVQMSMLPSVTRTHGQLEGQERVASWGETFRVEWLCTQRLQFHRTRHLRNPWNHGREIKMSRDGTELEPGVGQELVDLWSTLASEPASGSDARRAASSADKRTAKPIPKPGSSTKSKRVMKYETMMQHM